ncbi:MAG: hypothetical protein ACRDQA_17665 [Nocardioidaceae bacterium]
MIVRWMQAAVIVRKAIASAVVGSERRTWSRWAVVASSVANPGNARLAALRFRLGLEHSSVQHEHRDRGGHIEIHRTGRRQ